MSELRADPSNKEAALALLAAAGPDPPRTVALLIQHVRTIAPITDLGASPWYVDAWTELPVGDLRALLGSPSAAIFATRPTATSFEHFGDSRPPEARRTRRR